MQVASVLERYMLDLVNAERAALGLNALVLERNLNVSADAHSQWMTQTDTFSHTGAGGSSHTQRIVAADFDLRGSWRTAENLAAVSISGPESLFDEVDRMHANLMNSPTHRANILMPDLTWLGLGIVTGPMTYASGATRDSLLVTQHFAAASAGVADLDMAGDGRVFGGDGDDHLAGGAGADVLRGGNGDDVLVTGDGDDRVFAGSGDDRIEVGRGAGTKTIDAGEDTDSVVVAGTRGQMAFSLDAEGLLQVATGSGQLSLRNVETLVFDDGAVSVASLVSGLTGGGPGPQPDPDPGPPPAPGPDLRREYTGTSGADTLDGSAGNDLITGGGGTDRLRGAEGTDVLVAEARGLYGTEASGQVFRLYDTLFDRAPDSGGHQTFTARLASGATSLDQLAGDFLQSQEFALRFGSDTTDAEFVTLLYDNVFDRAPDARGFATWTGALAAGQSRAEVVRGFSESAEQRQRTEAALAQFEEVQDQARWSDDVYRLYGTLFGREADAGGFDHWTAQLANGADLQALVASLMQSAEFTARYGQTTDTEFVTRLYQNVLERAPDAGGLAAWTGALAGGMDRAEAVTRFMATPEYVMRSTPLLESFLRGLGTDDVLEAGAGDSLLSGGMYSDVFVFGTDCDGTHHITDMEAWDVLRLEGFGYADAGAALARITQQGEDAVFADQGVTVVLDGWEVAQITAAMIEVV